MERIIRITTIYGEVFTSVEYKRDKYFVYTYDDSIPFIDIEYIDIIGEVKNNG